MWVWMVQKREKLLQHRISTSCYYTNIAISFFEIEKCKRSVLILTLWMGKRRGQGKLYKIYCESIDKSENIIPRKPVKTELNNKTDRITIKSWGKGKKEYNSEHHHPHPIAWNIKSTANRLCYRYGFTPCANFIHPNFALFCRSASCFFLNQLLFFHYNFFRAL